LAALSAVPSGDALVDVLTYHVAAGVFGPLDLVDGGVLPMVNGAPVLFSLDGGARINDAQIVVTNVVASNGVIHVIDAVIIPPEGDIVETAVAADSFTALAGALTDAGLVAALQGEGPFTVFAPTDDAFGELAEVPTGDALENVLLYHVVSGAIGSGDLTAGNVETLSGQNVAVSVDGGVTVNDANVTTANILTRNGVIHVIDKVLNPE
jgi:transforming growth factor-beta-induced protein